MSTTPTDAEITLENVTVVPLLSGTMQHPAHSPLDTIEIAATDDILRDAALRNSSLRAPR